MDIIGSLPLETNSFIFSQSLLGTPNADQLFPTTANLAFSGGGADLLDATGGGGSNRMYGGSDGDELKAGNNDRLFGGGGNDILDASNGTNNRLYGGEGNDILFAGGGRNFVTGGEGTDDFWLVKDNLAPTANTITDFEDGAEVMLISGLTSVTKFEDLILVDNGENTLIQIKIGEENRDLVLLLGVPTSNLSKADFRFPEDTTAPSITASLTNDTGISNADGITSDANITGSINETSAIISFRAGLDDTTSENYLDVLSSLQGDGSFSFDTNKLKEINGNNDLANATHTLKLIAGDREGNNSEEFTLTFTLDTQAPTLTVNNPSDNTLISQGALLVGTTDGTGSGIASVTYRLNDGSEVTVTVDESGNFSQELNLEGLENTVSTLKVTTVDLAGNASTEENTVNILLTTESGLRYVDLEVGDGTTPTLQQSVTVNYIGFLTDGTVFDNGEGVTFALDRVILGFSEGISSMKVGGTRILVIPSFLGYGSNPPPGSGIPPNATLIFNVELLGIV
jgi:FKBP-type peptidyl-prolyl cis-trans isomerase